MGVLDTLGELVHHPIDTVSGMLGAATSPAKPGYTSADASKHLGSGIASQGAATVSGRKAQLDAQISEAGG